MLAFKAYPMLAVPLRLKVLFQFFDLGFQLPHAPLQSGNLCCLVVHILLQTLDLLLLAAILKSSLLAKVSVLIREAS